LGGWDARHPNIPTSQHPNILTSQPAGRRRDGDTIACHHGGFLARAAIQIQRGHDGICGIDHGKERIVIIDTKTGKQAGMIEDLKSPRRIVFLRPPG